MSKVIMVAFWILVTLCTNGISQSLSTRILWLEIDGKKINANYQILFVTEPDYKIIRANRTSKGFIVPDILKDQEYLTFRIRFRKLDLYFSNVHISKFKQDWIIGVDKFPYSEEYVDPEEAGKTTEAYYIKFRKDGILSTRLVVTTPSH